MIWMTPRRLAWVLRVRGTELAAWPLAERTAALSLMRRCDLARRVMAEALAQDDAPLADPALLARLQDGLGRRLALCNLATPVMRPIMRWGALTVCALAGLYLGYIGLDAEQPDVFAAVQAIAIDAAL